MSTMTEQQEQAKIEFQRIVNELIAAGWTPLKIAREISGGDEEFVRSYRPAIAQKILQGKTIPNWVVGQSLMALYDKEIKQRKSYSL